MTKGRKQLARILASIAGVDPNGALAFVDGLTFFAGTKNPDPALQPLIPVGNKVLMIPPILILTSDVERNLLALHSRLEPDTFDSQSHLFEKKMVTGLRSKIINNRQFISLTQFHVRRTDGKKEELDLVLIDQTNKCVLVVELRWTIQPGDPKEVTNRISACYEKLDQIKKKEDAARFSLGQIVQKAGLKSDEDLSSWMVFGMVVIEGFSGVPPRRVDYHPIVPSFIFERAVVKFQSLRLFITWIRGGAWLPVEGEHVVFSHSDFKFGPMTMHLRGCRPGGMATYDDHLNKSILAANSAL